jgi:iron complex transport system substrate-binding protein
MVAFRRGVKMQRLWPLFLFVVIFIVAIVNNNSDTEKVQLTTDHPQRIISLSPNITEIIFDLGAGERVVAVTDYCDFPKQAALLPKVGGFIQPNIETIVATEPDLVILLNAQHHTVEQLRKLNIKTLIVNNRTLSDITTAIEQIGKAIGYQQQAGLLLNQINNKINAIKQKTVNLPSPSVMISIGHSMASEQFEQIYIAGQQDFYNDLIELAGGKNVYQIDFPAVPSVSIEGILQLNPDIIIDIFPEADDHNKSLQQVKQQWQSLKQLNAVKHNQVYIIEEDYATIPGPRIFLLLEQLSALIHPESD